MQDGSLPTLYSRLLRGALEPSHLAVPDLWDDCPRGLSYSSCDHEVERGISFAPDCAALPDAHLPPVSSALSPRNGGKLGAADVREFGLDVIALIGTLRFCDHRSVPEIHQALLARGMRIAERTVLNLLQRYEELVAVRLADAKRLTSLLEQQGSVILAIDGLQPDVGHEVSWIIRDCLSGEILLA